MLDWHKAWQFAVKTVKDAYTDFGLAHARHVAGNWEKSCSFDAKKLLEQAGVTEVRHEYHRANATVGRNPAARKDPQKSGPVQTDPTEGGTRAAQKKISQA